VVGLKDHLKKKKESVFFVNLLSELKIAKTIFRNQIKKLEV
jgi:hypothetical protein